jgi:dihydroorotate dehydrogenase (fumarate)
MWSPHTGFPPARLECNAYSKIKVMRASTQVSPTACRAVFMASSEIKANMAATSGVHTAHDVLKVLMAGADVAMLCSTLLRNGIEHLRTIETQMCEWLEEHDYESVRQLQGSMSQKSIADPAAFERANYMKTRFEQNY